jgi:hypothetical protein
MDGFLKDAARAKPSIRGVDFFSASLIGVSRGHTVLQTLR